MANSTKTQPAKPNRRHLADGDSVIVSLGDLADQRALDIRGQIDQLDAEISKLYGEKVALTKELASVWSTV